MPPQRKTGKRGASAQKTKETPKSEQPAATAEHGSGGPGSPMAETHIGSPPEEVDTKPGLQVIVLVRTCIISSPLLCIPYLCGGPCYCLRSVAFRLRSFMVIYFVPLLLVWHSTRRLDVLQARCTQCCN